MSQPWTPPTDAGCCVDGCDLPGAGTRPSTEAYILEGESGDTVLPSGDIYEIVCALHRSGTQPDGSVA